MILVKLVIAFFVSIGALVTTAIGIGIIDSIDYNPITGKQTCRCSWGDGRKPNGKKTRVFLWSTQCRRHRGGPPVRAVRDEPFHKYATIEQRKKGSPLWPEYK